jgi:hypothetical protein
LNKLILTPETDLIKIEDPLLNKASMKLSMDHPGVKNYFFNLNKGNMKEDNLEWLDTTENYPGKIIIHLSSQGDNFIERNGYYNLGILKVSVNVSYVQLDRKNLVTRFKKILKPSSSKGAGNSKLPSSDNPSEQFEKVDLDIEDYLSEAPPGKDKKQG